MSILEELAQEVEHALGHKCTGCEGPTSPDEHPCPNAEDIHGDSSPCMCCDKCTSICALEI